ncbi:MAG: hypothetical protein ABIO65_08035 [Nitrospiria bacterium]
MVLLAVQVGVACRSDDDQVRTPGPAAGIVLPLAFEHRHALADKAAWFEDKIGRSHLTSHGLLAYQIDPQRDDAFPTARADMAIWSGVYLAAEAFRYQATRSTDASDRLDVLVGGIESLVRVTGKPGLLARSIRRREGSEPLTDHWHRSPTDPDVLWLGNVSVDQLDGIVFGAGAAFDALDDGPSRRRVVEWTRAVVGHLVDHDMRIEDITGRPTKHSDFTCGFLSESLNCLIALSAVKVAHHVTGEERFERAYAALVRRGYAERAVAARRPWWERVTGVNHSDNHLAFLAYYHLIRYEEDPRLLDLYHRSLRRAWSVVRREKNAFFTLVYHSLTPRSGWDHAALADAVETLTRFPTASSRYDPEATRCMAARADRLGRPQTCRPLPIDERPPASVEWNQNPSRWGRGGTGDRRAFSGFDFLTAYWLGRAHGFIPGDA